MASWKKSYVQSHARGSASDGSLERLRLHLLPWECMEQDGPGWESSSCCAEELVDEGKVLVVVVSLFDSAGCRIPI